MSVKNELQIIPLPPVYLPVTKDWCETQTQIVDFAYTWTIRDFSICAELMGEKLTSSVFPTQDNNSYNFSWCLDLYPRGINQEFQDYVSLNLVCKNPYKQKIEAKCRFYILNHKMEETNGLKYVFKYVESGEYAIRQFIRRDQLERERITLLPKDKLMIVCRIRASLERTNVTNQSRELPFDHRSTLSEDFKGLFLNPKFSDYSLTSEGQDFPVHKVILSARSKVFRAMFEHNMEANKENSTAMTDISAEVLKELLRYIYTDQVENLEKVAKDLMIASDLYGVVQCKIMCEKVICNALTVDNALDLLVIADYHNAQYLKEETIRFILNNARDIVNTPSYQNIPNTESHVLRQVYAALSLWTTHL